MATSLSPGGSSSRGTTGGESQHNRSSHQRSHHHHHHHHHNNNNINNHHHNSHSSLGGADISGLTVSNAKTAAPLSSHTSREHHGSPPNSSAAAPALATHRRTGGGVRAAWLYRGGGGSGGGAAAAGERRRKVIDRLVTSLVWKVVLIICSIILLFGAQVRELLPLLPQLDRAIDVVFCLVLAVLLLDVMLRCDAETDYFCCYHRCHHGPGGGGGGGGGGRAAASARKWKSGGGSFLFWCDLISALTLLYDISFFHTLHFREQHIIVTLQNATSNDFTGLSWSFTRQSPVELEWTMLSLVFQTFRVARFIRSSRALKASVKMDWYSFVNIFLPARWKKMHQNKRGHQLLFHEQGRSSDLLVGRRWSVLGISMLAAAKASSMSANLHAPWWKRLFRRSTFDTEEFRQHLAATRIQRAWRAVAKASNPPGDFTSVELDVGWNTPQGSSMIRRNKSVKTATFQQQPPPVGASMPYRRPSSNKNININSGHTKKVGAHNNTHNAHAAEALEKRRNESQVGSKMRELTGQRVAFGIILALLFSVFFTYVEKDTTRPLTMIILHRQTSNPLFAEKALNAARKSSIPDLILYGYADGTEKEFVVKGEISKVEELRPREKLRITVETAEDGTNPTYALFSLRNERQDEAIVSLLSTVFIIMVWFFGVGSFAGPVMVLVVIPIERMVKLLGMLTLDPLGYQSTSRYKRFLDEENELTKNTRWTKEILKGMETSFLMSTILRIGSLMKVGFGSAGVEIIRNNLEPGQSKNTLILSSQGSTVSCIFLFCDIRNFTDATECLQEEVFVFTNRIAAVVHSFCHAYGGSANKNVGDAFLISWQLEEDLSSASSNMGVPDGHDSFSWSQHQGSLGKSDGFIAKNNQADKALLSVVKICMALYYDNYFIETLSKGARDALVSKLKHRQGPVVQMGFGMHAGRAVQGAIGSQRKIDPTYVSEAVERAEFLESSTKKYGVKLLMSESFHRLLHTSNRRRCRKVDQIIIRDDDEADEDDLTLNGEIMELFTFDMDIDALSLKHDLINRDQSDTASEAGSKRGLPRRGGKRLSLRLGMNRMDGGSDELDLSGFLNPPALTEEPQDGRPPKLVLPSGPALYNANVWTSEDMRTIRQLYSDGLFFQKFMSGLQSFYSKDWEHSKNCFAVILERIEDGPSRYFMNQIEKYNGKPPRDFPGYGSAS